MSKITCPNINFDDFFGYLYYMNENFTYNTWTDAEIKVLIEKYENTRDIDLSKIFNRTVASIKSKARFLKLYKSKEFRKYLIGKRNKMVGRNLTVDLLSEIAQKFKSRSEFQIKDSAAYQTARRLGILDIICKHMFTLNFSIPQLILKSIMDGILKLTSVYNTRKIISPYEIDLYYPTIKLAVEYNGKYWHKNNPNDYLKRKLLDDKNINIITITEKNRKYEEDIKSQLILNLNKINLISKLKITPTQISNYNIKNIYSKVYSVPDLLNISKSYNSFKEFYTKESSVYYKLHKLKLIDKATSHMSDRLKKWNLESLKLTISKYKTLKDLIAHDKGAYLHIKRNKLNELINHLTDGRRLYTSS